MKTHTPIKTYTPTAIHTTSSRSRSIFIAILALLCIPVFLYQLFPSYTHTTEKLVGNVVSHFHHPVAESSSCTKEVGSPTCCAMFLDAAPCVDECRNTHVDRETLVLTYEYDECADVCLSAYTKTCSSEAQHT
jgi:hypothetical protein